MTRPLLLDLFCGAGGAAMGYHRAGFDVVGVDIKPQPRYPFRFYQEDAMYFLSKMTWAHSWAAIHASPPCQAYIRGGTVDKVKYPDLIDRVRVMLEARGVPWVIENVPGAPMRPDIQLCGSMFGLQVRRHRWFETNMTWFPLVSPCVHNAPITGVYGHPHGNRGAWRGMLPSTLATWSGAMGIDWMDASELREAIPPAYTEFIGEQLLECVITIRESRFITQGVIEHRPNRP